MPLDLDGILKEDASLLHVKGNTTFKHVVRNIKTQADLHESTGQQKIAIAFTEALKHYKFLIDHFPIFRQEQATQDVTPFGSVLDYVNTEYQKLTGQPPKYE